MLAAFFLLAAAPNWVPARWNSGDPKSLELLNGTPVNCVLLESSSWNPDFVKQASERNIATLAVLHPPADLAEQARRAKELKMAGVVLEGDYPAEAAEKVRAQLAGTDLRTIELPLRRRIRLESRDPILGTSQGLWPGIEIEHGGKTMTGPTSNPWIDTNAGFVRFLRAASEATLWIGVRPPAGRAISVQRYAVVMADAFMSGARWIVALDDDLDRRLLAGDPKAVAAWKQIAGYMNYFEHPRWSEFHPYSTFALIQDAESGGMLSASLLDLLTVQHTAVRPIATRKLTRESLDGARVILNVDAESISAEQKEMLAEFTAAGGTLVNPPPGWRFPTTSDAQLTPDRRQMNEIQRVWETAYNATVRKNFGARTFNTASVLFNVLATADGKSLLIHIVNYADFTAETVIVQALGEWKRARLYRPDAPMKELSVYEVRAGTGIDIDRIPLIGTLRLDR